MARTSEYLNLFAGVRTSSTEELRGTDIPPFGGVDWVVRDEGTPFEKWRRWTFHITLTSGQVVKATRMKRRR
jgi:hypothetical protein